MIQNVYLEKLCLRFQDFSGNYLLKNWDWKIDPWKSAAEPIRAADFIIVSINQEFQTINTQSFQLISKEKTGFFERTVYQTPNKDFLWEFSRVVEKRSALQFMVNKEWNRIILLKDTTGTQGSVAFEYLAQIFPGICLKNKMITFHSALVEHEGSAFAICANSGVGKTTHARLWRDKKRALILNGDRAVIKRAEGGWTAYGTPWSGTSGEQVNRSAPLKAMVVLERAEENSVYRLSSSEAFAYLFPHLLYPRWDAELTGNAMEQIDKLLQEIPVFRLRCRPDENAVETLYQALKEEN